MNVIDFHTIDYADARVGDIVVDAAWPDMFGRKVIRTETVPLGGCGMITHLVLSGSAGLSAAPLTRIGVLR